MHYYSSFIHCIIHCRNQKRVLYVSIHITTLLSWRGKKFYAERYMHIENNITHSFVFQYIPYIYSLYDVVNLQIWSNFTVVILFNR